LGTNFPLTITSEPGLHIYTGISALDKKAEHDYIQSWRMPSVEIVLQVCLDWQKRYRRSLRKAGL
jgi:hypothetical protein